MASKPKSADVVPFPGLDVELPDEIPVGRKLSVAQLGAPAVAALKLEPGPKVLFVPGPGRVGKSTFLRWLIEHLLIDAERDKAELSTVLATLDPKRTLCGFFDGIRVPPSNDPASAAVWLESLLQYVMARRVSAAIDFAGDDAALSQVVTAMPNLVAVMEEAGVIPVAIYILSPRVEDLDQLATLEGGGFQPRATALVLNEGAMPDITKSRDDAFAAIMRHSVYKAAIARGAVQLWMPRLRSADQVELRQIRFEEARAGTRAVPMGPFDRSYVAHWLAAMQSSFGPIATWFPR